MNAPPQATVPPPPATQLTAQATPNKPRRVPGREDLKYPLLGLILALSAVLNTNRLSQNGYANIFYSAGAKSMLASWHNFLYVSFDPGGLITVDKPPLGIWMQVASAKVFGFSPLSLLLPEAIIGVLAVAALYWVMARRCGTVAALTGALALAVFPSFVAVSRENGVDALLLLLLILAAGAALRATETGGWRPLVGCAVLIGLAFNTKTLAAYLLVPSVALAYLVCAPSSIANRLGKLVLAGVVMALVSFAWIAIVELTPASKRPFVGSSTNNTELGLTFEYNGFGRVGGEVGGPGQIPIGSGALANSPVSHSHTTRSRTTFVSGGVRSPRLGSRPHDRRSTPPPAKPVPSKFLPNGRLRNPIAFEAKVGPLRLFETGLGEQGGWMIPFAICGLLALAFGLLLPRRGGLGLQADERDTPGIDRRDPRLACLLVFGGWFAVEAVVLSTSKGIVHPYYVSGLAPGTAAMFGAGAVALCTARSWRLLLVVVAVAGTVAAQLAQLDREHFMHWFWPVLIIACAVGVVLLLAVPRFRALTMGFVVVVLLIAPATFAATTWRAPVYGTFPAAGPRQAAGYGGYGVSPKSLSLDLRLARYVSTHHPTRRWELLTVASDTAAPFILMGMNAGSIAGYSGTDPALDGPSLARLVRAHQARYVVLGGAYSTRGGNPATVAVGRVCRRVPPAMWDSHAYSIYSLSLFDCAGRERQLAAS